MTCMKLCGISRPCDIEVINEIKPEYIGFVCAQKSRRYVTIERMRELKSLLTPEVKAVGVFVDAPMAQAVELLNSDVIDIAQLHGHEDEDYIRILKAATGKPVIRAFKIQADSDLEAIESSPADFVLLDSGAGTGETFDWNKVKSIKRPFFLAGGLGPENVARAIREVAPYAVDVSSGIETCGLKDRDKMVEFAAIVRKETR